MLPQKKSQAPNREQKIFSLLYPKSHLSYILCQHMLCKTNFSPYSPNQDSADLEMIFQLMRLSLII